MNCYQQEVRPIRQKLYQKECDYIQQGKTLIKELTDLLEQDGHFTSTEIADTAVTFFNHMRAIILSDTFDKYYERKE